MWIESGPYNLLEECRKRGIVRYLGEDFFVSEAKKTERKKKEKDDRCL